MPIGSEVLVGGRVTPAELIQDAQSRVRMSEFETGRALATAAAEAAWAAGDEVTRAEALVVVAHAWRQQEDFPETLATAFLAVEICRSAGAPAVEARARSEIARVLVSTGDCSDGLQEGLAALALAEGCGDPAATVSALTALGNVYLMLEQDDLAIEVCERGAETARLMGDEIQNGALQDTIACVLLGVGELARADADRPAEIAAGRAASERSRAAMLIARKHGHRRNEATALANLAEGLAMAGEPEEGLALLESWEFDPERDSIGMINQFLDTRGTICLSLGRFDEAIELYTRALERPDSRQMETWFCEHLATAYEEAGDLANAVTWYKRYHQLYCQAASEQAHRNARVAAVRMETEQAKALAEQERRRADGLLRMSLEDPLTGLANRRHLDERLAIGVATHTVALIDVDHFKQVNDRFSHQIGDEVLRRLATLLRDACRSDDLAARYGGEEFAILFHNLSLAEATTAAERIRQSIAEYPWAVVAPGLQVTVSIGIAVRGESPRPESQLAVADRRLYEAKHAGRNRVVGRD